MPLNEGNSGTTPATFTITLSSPWSQPVSVHWATADGTATTSDNDYQGASGTATFQHGQTTQTITIQVVGDTKNEPDETFFVNLSNPSSPATISRGQGTGTIVNDDPAAPVKTIVAPDGTRFLLDFQSDLWSSAPATSTWTRLDNGVANFDIAGNGDIIDYHAGNGGLYEFTRTAAGLLDLGAASYAIAGNGDIIDYHTSHGGLYEFTRTAAGLFDLNAYHLLDLDVASYAIAGNGDIIDYHASNGGLYEFTRTAAGLFDLNAYHLLVTAMTSYAIAGNGDVIALEVTGKLFEFTRTAAGLFDPNAYHLFDTGVSSFAIAGNGDVVVLDGGGGVYEFFRTSSNIFSTSTDRQLDTNVTAIAVTAAGSLFDLRADKSLWQYNGSWSRLSDNVQSMTLAPDGFLYYLRTDGGLIGGWAGNWITLDSSVQTIVLATDGAVIATKNDGSQWRYYDLQGERIS